MRQKNIGLISFKNEHSEIEIDQQSRKVSGYFASFNNKDSDDDIILKGAFSKSISERGPGTSSPNKIAFLWQHDMSEPIGRIDVLTEDEKGLYFEASVSEFDLGDRVLAQYQDGTLNQHSIGFKYIKDKIEYVEDEDAFYIKEVNLFEGSVVTLGANPQTPFMGMKDITELEQLKEIETFIKKLNLDKNDIFTLRKYFEIYKHLEPSIKDTLSRNDERNHVEESQTSANVCLDYEYILKSLKGE